MEEAHVLFFFSATDADHEGGSVHAVGRSTRLMSTHHRAGAK